MRTDRRFQALISVQAALTALKGSRAVHCKAQEHSAAHLQGGCATMLPLSVVFSRSNDADQPFYAC